MPRNKNVSNILLYFNKRYFICGLIIYIVLKNDGSKIRGVVGDAKISGKCRNN